MLKRFVVVAIVAALPATVMAVEWTGLVDSTWDYASQSGNWDGDPETGGFDTTEARVHMGEWGDPDPPYMPVIGPGNFTQWGYGNIRNSAVVTQTGGYHEWVNGSGTWASLSLHNETWWSASSATSGDYTTPATIHMTGGVHVVNGNCSIGYQDMSDEGPGLLEIWGDGVFQITVSEWHGTALLIASDSLIDIRDSGQLMVPLALATDALGYMDTDLIVNGHTGDGADLVYTADADYMYITTPEPASLLMLGLGVVLLRRRRA